MATKTKFKYSSYDFSNNINMPESEHQERRLEALLDKGWKIEASVFTDVYLSILWRLDGEEVADSQPSADLQQELHDAQQRAEHAELEAEGLRAALDRANANLNEAQGERDQARELARQLQAREAEAPASVQSGDTEVPQ
jgi:hypothetical protein